MAHTVGIAGVNGNVGAPTTKLLAKAAEEGRINLIVFTRTGSTAPIPATKNVIIRELNFDDAPAKIEKAVEGVNVFISAVGFQGLSSEPNVVDALAKSPDFVTFIPAAFSTTWDAKDFEDPQLTHILNFIYSGWNRAKERGIGITPLYIGAFENYWFDIGFLGAPIKNNTVWASEKQLRNPFPITVLDHVASAIEQIATQDPQIVKNQTFSAVTFWPTGQEMVDLYTKLNGKQASIKPWTPTDRDAMNADLANSGPVKVGFWDRWENKTWRYHEFTALEFNGTSLECYAKKFL